MGDCSPRCHETSLTLESIAESGAAAGEPGSVRLCSLVHERKRESVYRNSSHKSSQEGETASICFKTALYVFVIPPTPF